MTALLRIGVSRTHGKRDLDGHCARFASCLGAALGRNASVVVARDYDHLVDGVVVGGIDVAWMPPVALAKAVARGALLAAVSERRGQVMYKSAILAKGELPTAPRAAWVDPSSASGYLFPRLHLLAQHDFAFGRETFHGSFTAAVGALAAGDADLSATYAPLAAKANEKTRDDIARNLGIDLGGLRVIAVTDPIPPDGMVLASAALGTDVMRVRDVLLRFHSLVGGREALRLMTDAERLVPVLKEVANAISALARK